MFTADQTLGANRWPVVRLLPGSTCEVVLLSERFFALTTHWCKYTVACCGDDCELCELLPSRGLFYVACMSAGCVRILELGAQSSSHFEQHCRLLHGGMRAGLVVALTRRTKKSPVYSEVVRVQPNVKAVGLLSLAKHVLALYKFPPPNPDDDVLQYENRIRQAAKIRNARLASQLLAKSKLAGLNGR